MPGISLRLIANLVFASLLLLFSMTVGQPIRAASANLVWKPFLQQLTNASVIILWATQTGQNPTVQYSTDTSYNASATGSSRIVSGRQLHRVQLTGLEPDTIYYYKVYTDDQDLLPDELLSFQTAPSTGSTTPFTFVVFGDYGIGSDSQRQLRDQMLVDSFRFILSTGDNAYYSGTYLQLDANVFQIYQDIFSKAALFPTLGNHDYQTNDGTPYLDIFELPPNAWRNEDIERYYAFDFGNVHFVALDSNAPLDVNDNAASDDMFDWLRSDLSQTAQPWRIAVLHHPAYSAGSHGSDSRVQSKLVPIFEDYGVDAVFLGHDHNYQRSWPLRGGQITTVEQGGIVYVVSGAGSAASYSCGSRNWLAIAYCSQSYGIYARVTVSGDSLTLQAIDDVGEVKDEYIVSKAITSLDGVELSGPITGLLHTDHSYLAVASPTTATLPITYAWRATDQPPVINAGALTDVESFSWGTTGTKYITVTATSAGVAVTDTLTVEILPVRVQVYLPAVFKNH